MSTPKNPLSQYYTYSYHHILVACNTTVVAEALQESNSLTSFLRPPGFENTTENRFGKYDAINFEDKGKYCIIINGMIDSEFVIQSATWFTTTAASAGPNGTDRFTTLGCEGTVVVQEPRGIKFLNVLGHVADQLESDPSGLVFMVKTIFVGHPAPGASFVDPTRPDSGEVYDPIVNIRPLLFIFVDVVGEFKVTGGVYTITFLALNNSASKHHAIRKSADRIKLNLNNPKPSTNQNANEQSWDTRTLAGALKYLESELNNVYIDYFNDIKEKVQKAQKTFNGRQVKYRIEAEEPYVRKVNGTISPNPDYAMDDFVQQTTDGGEAGQPGIIDVSTASTVESAINMVVARCKKVKEDAGRGDQEGSESKAKYVHKVASTVVSTNDDYTVVFKLRRMLEPRSNIIEQVLKRESDDVNAIDQNISKNTIEFDYFFTGKNTDITKFDIKMEMGLAFFQTLVSTDTLKESEAGTGLIVQTNGGNDEGNRKTTQGKLPGNETPNTPPTIRAKTPIFLSTKFDDKMLKNTTDSKLSNDFQTLLNRHAALENLDAVLQIHGNSGLLNATNRQPSEVVEQVSPEDVQSDPAKDTFPYWETSPSLVKINIRMPSDDKDGDFSEPFWYEGFYHCYGIVHKFSGGEFTQELKMISLPQATNYDDEISESEKTPENTESAEGKPTPAPAETQVAEATKRPSTGTKLPEADDDGLVADADGFTSQDLSVGDDDQTENETSQEETPSTSSKNRPSDEVEEQETSTGGRRRTTANAVVSTNQTSNATTEIEEQTPETGGKRRTTSSAVVTTNQTPADVPAANQTNITADAYIKAFTT